MTKILLVEDNAMNLDMLKRRLERNGFQVIAAEDGVRGMLLALEASPHIILMDMSLPGLDGWEATRRLKSQAQTRSIPILGLSAHAMTHDRQKAMDAGCDDYDTKPVDMDRLLGKIHALLGKGSMHSDPPPVLNREEAIAICSGDEELFLEMAALFVIDAAGLIEKAQAALSSGGADAVAEAAHAAKGIAANICAGPFKEAAHQLQMAARDKDFPRLPRLFEKFHAEHARLRDYLMTIIPAEPK